MRVCKRVEIRVERCNYKEKLSTRKVPHVAHTVHHDAAVPVAARRQNCGVIDDHFVNDRLLFQRQSERSD